MDKAFEVNEKLMIISIIVGFILGIYLAIVHDNPDLWFVIIQWIFLTAIIITLIPSIVGLTDRIKNDGKFSLVDLLRMLALNIAVVAVCASFGFVLGSILIGNYIVD